MASVEPERIRRIEAQARALMKDALPSHGWDHVERVRKLARRIARAEGADEAIVDLAAILHDTGRKEEDESRGKICHAEVSEGHARRILGAEGYDGETIERVCACILTHRFRKNRPPGSIEAKALFDADKLDAIGAVGVARAFLFAGEVGARLHNPEIEIDPAGAYGIEDSAWREFQVKLRFLRDRMLTGEGRRIADRRHAYMEEFFRLLGEESDGAL
jgi:uncharacterized protein